MTIKKAAVAALAVFALSGTANAALFELSLNTVASWDTQGDSSNTTITLDLAALLGFGSGTPLVITQVGWETTIETEGGSWLSEATVLYENSDGTDGLNITPGVGDDGPGSATYTSDGLLDLASIDPELVVDLPDGILVIEFYDSFDDVADAVDATWRDTKLSIDAQVVPVPAALPLLLSALGLTGFLARRRG